VSTDRPDDTSWRHTSQLAFAAELCGERVTIRASRTTDNAVTVVASPARGRLPRSVINHRAFNGEHSAIFVKNDQEEWCVGFIVGHGTSLAHRIADRETTSETEAGSVGHRTENAWVIG
jgi:hypothetical protein